MALVDAGYGNDSKLRTGITELEKRYVAGIQPQSTGVEAGQATGPGTEESGTVTRPIRSRSGDLALELRKRAWRSDPMAGGQQ